MAPSILRYHSVPAAPPAGTPFRMRRPVVLVPIAFIVAGGLLWSLLPSGEAADEVEAIDVVRAELATTLTLTGNVVNDYTVSLTALLDGEITSISAREGDRVDAGAVLGTLDDAPPRALLDKAEAELTLRQYELELAGQREARMQGLSRTGGESSQALEDAERESRRATAAERVAVADRALAALALRNAAVRAPYAGVVIEQAVETGQWVEAGTPLFTLVAEAGRAIEAEADAGDFSRVAVGQAVRLALADDPEASWDSEIVRVAESVSTGNGTSGNTFTLRIALGEDTPRLLLGQQLDVDIATARRADVLVLPLDAIVETDEGEAHVFVEEGGVARRRPVTLGLATIDRAEIVEGLVEGDRVLLPGGASLSDGANVEVTGDGASGSVTRP